MMNMWWKVVSFCVSVLIVLLVVISCITGRPPHLLFHRCCDEGIENDQMALFDNFGHNFLRERLISKDTIEDIEKDVKLNETVSRLTNLTLNLTLGAEAKLTIPETDLNNNNETKNEVESYVKLQESENKNYRSITNSKNNVEIIETDKSVTDRGDIEVIGLRNVDGITTIDINEQNFWIIFKNKTVEGEEITENLKWTDEALKVRQKVIK